MRTWFSPHGTEWQAETYEEALEQERDALVEQLETLRQAAIALHERVEMDESVGICLSTRAESMALGALLSNPAEKWPGATAFYRSVSSPAKRPT